MNNAGFGHEHGPNLIKVSKKLINNQNLLKLLVNTDKDPLNPQTHPDIIDGMKLLNKSIKVVPLLEQEEITESKIVILFIDGAKGGNVDNENITMLVNVYCPFEEWLIAGDTIRPFAIMSEVRESLQDKRINGLGEISYSGFSLSTLTDDMGCYTLRFTINAFI